MKNKSLLITAMAALLAIGFTAQGQVVPAPLAPATNAPTTASPAFNAILNILPAWNPTLTNTFPDSEFDIESAPLWKSMTAAGTTPFNSTEGDYFFSRNVGLGGELITLGNGSGNNTVDTVQANLTLRKDIGNIAGYGLIGGGYDLNRHKGDVAIGPGIVYGYQTHIRLFLDTRCEIEGQKQQDIGWLTRIGMQLDF